MSDGTSYALDDAVVGSEVYINTEHRERITTVSAVTAKTVTLADGSKWTRRGKEWGVSDHYYGARAHVVTDRAQIERHIASLNRERVTRHKRYELRQTNWSQFSDEFIDQIHALWTAERAKEQKLRTPFGS